MSSSLDFPPRSAEALDLRVKQYQERRDFREPLRGCLRWAESLFRRQFILPALRYVIFRVEFDMFSDGVLKNSCHYADRHPFHYSCMPSANWHTATSAMAFIHSK